MFLLPLPLSFSLGIAERGTRKPDDRGISRYFPKGFERKWRCLADDRGKSASRKISARDFHANSIFRRSLFSFALCRKICGTRIYGGKNFHLFSFSFLSVRENALILKHRHVRELQAGESSI